MTNLVAPDDATLEAHLEQAKTQHHHQVSALQSLIEANKELSSTPAGTSSGHMVFATAFIWGKVQAVTNYEGRDLEFNAEQWGVGFGGGITWGGFVFNVSVAELIQGSCVVNVLATAVACNANWWRGSKYLGSYVGGGLGVGFSITGMSGSWEAK